MVYVPEHSPAPTPSRAVYGFATYLIFNTFFVMYVLWAVIPEKWFRYIGITCLPQRYWAVAVPIFIITAILIFGFLIYPSLNLCLTPSFTDIRTITDETVQKQFSTQQSHPSCEDDFLNCMCRNKSKCSKQIFFKSCTKFSEKCIPSVQDLDIVDVSKALYLKHKKA